MFDNSGVVTVSLTVFLLSSYLFLAATQTNYEVLECIKCAQERLVVSGRIQGVLFVPDDPVKKILLGLIHAEKKSIKAAVYQLTDPDLVDALIDAHKRGVNIEVITDKSCLMSKYEGITKLKRQKIPVYVYGEKFYSIMHNKFWVFGKNLYNKALVWSGSANATKYGTTRNEENVFVDDRSTVVMMYSQKFDRLKKKIGLKVTTSKPRPRPNHIKPLYGMVELVFM
jgi:mitochondrial cardiolipin hydrolase